MTGRPDERSDLRALWLYLVGTPFAGALAALVTGGPAERVAGAATAGGLFAVVATVVTVRQRRGVAFRASRRLVMAAFALAAVLFVAAAVVLDEPVVAAFALLPLAGLSYVASGRSRVG